MVRVSTTGLMVLAAAAMVSGLSVVSDDWRPRETRGTGRARDNKGLKLYGECCIQISDILAMAHLAHGKSFIPSKTAR